MTTHAQSSSHVLAVIPTKDRFRSTLPMTLLAVSMQTRLPQALLIYNDGREPFPGAEPIYVEMLRQLEHKGVEVQVVEGRRLGQHFGHQAALEQARELVWRVDDDEMPEPETLARLLDHMGPGVGAVAPLVIIPRYAKIGLPSVASGAIADCLFAPNPQWFFHDGRLLEVEHLYSSFVYRREAGLAAGGFCLELSSIASREETLFSFGLKQAGYRLLVDTSALIWHLQNPEGGIRAYRGPQAAEALRHDEQIFLDRMQRAGVEMVRPLLITLDAAEQDHRDFLRRLPELRARLGGVHLFVAARHPRMLEGAQAKVIPLAEKALLSYFREIDLDGRPLALGPARPSRPRAEAPLSFYMPAKRPGA